MMKSTKNSSDKEVYERIAAFCAYQERSPKEVEQKLKTWGVENIAFFIQKLGNDKFLNEERFAKTFAGSKFRMLKWGRNKIFLELKSRGISEQYIHKALLEISEEEYKKTIIALAQKKKKSIPNTIPTYKAKMLIIRFLVGKGYEFESLQRYLGDIDENVDLS